MLRFRLFSAALVLTLCACQPAHIEIDGQRYASADLVFPQNDRDWHDYTAKGAEFAIATDAPEASRAAAQIYEAGGNAIDAAVAASFAIAVVRPQSTGLGGGGFLLYHDPATKRSYAYDFRERAPQAAKRDMYLDANGKVDSRASLFGPRAAATPGFVPGLLLVHRRHGKLPLEAVLAPALVLARNGFPVYPDLENSIADALEDFDEEARKVFAPDGRPLRSGAILKQTALGETLSRIIQHGEADFRSGQSAAAIVDATERFVTVNDLKSYTVEESAPLEMQIGELTLQTIPPPSSGVFLLSMLGAIHQLDGGAACSADSLRCEHLRVEILRRGFADRARFGGDRLAMPARELLAADRIGSMARGVDPQRAAESARLLDGVTVLDESPETTHISILDSSGAAVSTTHSINYRFGSRRMAPGCGFLLNDTMDDFAVAPGQSNVYGLPGSEANAIAAGRTPLSSMSPLFALRNGRVEAALGAPGGSRIISTIYHVFLNYQQAMHPYAAVARGRTHHQWSPDLLYFEKESAAAGYREQLESMGHRLKEGRMPGKAFLAVRRGESLYAAADPRGDGLAIAR